MDVTVFYAWQSDRPEKLNHHLISDAAKEACARITADPSNDWNVTLDSDTKGTPGMCDIPNTILEKIRKCDIFLADLTLVGETASTSPKHLPNANVVFELGYAARQLSFKAMIGVVNEAFGKVEGQVFDIKRRACLKYTAAEATTNPERKKAQDTLIKRLEEVIRGTIQTVVIPKRNKPGPEARALQEEYISSVCEELQTQLAELVRLDSAERGGISKKPAYWECIINPSLMAERHLLETLAKCRSTISECQIGPSTCPLPDLIHSKPSVGDDWIGGNMNNFGLECWRLTQRAVFASILSAREVPTPPSLKPSISLEDMIFRLTQVFRFAAKLAENTARSSEFDVTVQLKDIDNRTLLVEGGWGRFQYASGQNDLSHSWHCSRKELQDPDLLAVKAGYWFCERFNWHHVTEDQLAIVQKRFLAQLGL